MAVTSIQGEFERILTIARTHIGKYSRSNVNQNCRKKGLSFFDLLFWTRKKVEKKKAGDRVVSSIRILKGEERIKEVAKLMSGEKVTEATLNGARELMGLSKN